MFKYLPVKPIKNYLHRTESYSVVRLIFELTFLSIFLRILLLFPILVFSDLHSASTTELVSSNAESFVELFMTSVVVAPILETAVGQWLPISIGSLFTGNQAELLILSCPFFAFLHSYAGFTNVLAVFPFSLFLSWAFLLKRSAFWKAFGITTAIHSFHNFIGLLAYTLSRSIDLR
jgi:hypothetical protein